MASAQGTPSPFDDRPRFTTPSPWDAQAGLWIVTILSITYAFSTLPIRHIIRRKFVWTDVALCLGFVLATCSYIFMFLALQSGAGIAPDHLSTHRYQQASRYVFTSIIFLFLTGGCSACSQLCLLEELVPGTEEKMACWAAVVLCACSAIASAVSVSAGCTSTDTLNTDANGSCPNPIPRWSAALALVMVVNAIPALIPVYLFRTLRTRLQRRSGLYFAFAFPLITIPLAATAIHLFIDATHYGDDGTGLVGFLCCMEAILGWELILPTIPLGRPMALRFTTHGTIILGEGYGSGLESGVRGTFPPKPGRSNGDPSKRRPSHRLYDDEIELRPDLFMHSSIIRHESRDGVLHECSGGLLMDGQGSQSSQRMTAVEGIRRTVQTDVESFHTEDVMSHR